MRGSATAAPGAAARVAAGFWEAEPMAEAEGPVGRNSGVPAAAAAGALARVTGVGAASGPSSGVVTPEVCGDGGAATAGSG